MLALRPVASFFQRRCRSRALRALAVALLVAVLAPMHPARADYVATPGAAKRAYDAILGRMGHTPRVVEIVIDHYRVAVRVQGRQRTHHVDEWMAQRGLIPFLGDSVSGPLAASAPTYVSEIEGGFFDASEVALDKLDSMIRTAIERAALEDPPEVAGLRLARDVLSSPRPAYGPVRWEVRITSRSENATAYFAPDGTLRSIDLSGTLRARRLDLVADNSFFDAATADIRAVVGDKPVIHEISFHRTYVFIKTDSPRDPARETRYSWSLSGMRGGTDDSHNSMRVFRSKVPFAFTEVDFKVLPDLKAAAFKALDMEGGRITRLQADKPTEGAGSPRVLWDIEIKAANNEEGRVVADATGKIVRVVLPPSRRKALVWLEPQTVRATLQRIGTEIGETTRLHELLLNDRGASLTAEDKTKPGELMSLVVDADTIRRFGTPMFEKKANPARAFTIADLKGLDAESIEGLVSRTMQRLKLKDGKLTRPTFSRGDAFVRPPDGKIMVEIRTETKDGRNGGRIVYTIDGQELQVVPP
jgi:hypothetical protein